MFKRAAWSSELGKKGGYLVALSRGDRLMFDGCLELSVVTGSVEIHGFLVTSSQPPLSLFSPLNSPRLPILPSSSSHCQLGAGLAVKGCGLGAEDEEWLNSLTLDSLLAVCAVWNLDSPLVTGLHSVPNSGLLLPSPHLDGKKAATFRLIKDADDTPISKLILFPEEFHTHLNRIVEYRGPVVLVCGDSNSGKSTLCRFLVNKFLNRVERVGFLECDVGQPEFTVPMVTSLHLLTSPVFGPAHFGHRRPYKAYFFGELSPACKPRYYLHLIKQLHLLFMNDIHGDGEVPLIINTCGWTKYMGVALLMDIIRLTSPSHIVRMVPDRRRMFDVTNLLPFTPHTLSTTPGVLSPSSSSSISWAEEEQWYSDHISGLSAPQPTPAHWEVYQPNKRGCPTPDPSDAAEPSSKRHQTMAVSRESTEENVTDSSSEELVSDSDDRQVMDAEAAQALPTSSLQGSTSPVGGVRRHKRRAQGQRSKIARSGLHCLIPEPKYGNGTPLVINGSSDHWEEVERQLIGQWVKVLNHQVLTLKLKGCNGAHNKKKSSVLRRLSFAAHFSPLISGCGDHAHFLGGAPVLEVSWSDIAIHVLHQQVPRSAVMSAMVGGLVALCRVDPHEVVEENLVGGGSVRFLCSQTPILEFLAMGILHKSSPEKQLFYVTTPLIMDSDVAMDTADVLVMGEVSSLYGFTEPKATPTSFHHIDIGQFAWRKLT